MNSDMSDRRARAPMDPEMRAFLDATTDNATQALDPLETPLPEMRRAIEAGRIGYAAGGAVMREAVDRPLEGSGRFILARFNMPEADGPLPALVLLHGGGWTWNTIYTGDRTAREYAARAGAAVIAPDYSLSPEYKFPQALNECVAVLRAVRARAAEWGIDPDRIAVGGDSAGGNLALAAALVLRDEDENWLRGALLNYGVFDSDFTRESYRLYGGGDLYLSTRLMRFFWGNYVRTPDQMTHPLAAPLCADLTGLPPLRIVAAELDVLADENHALAERARNAGVDTEYALYEGVTHGFLRAAASVAKAERCLADGALWLTRIFA